MVTYRVSDLEQIAGWNADALPTHSELGVAQLGPLWDRLTAQDERQAQMAEQLQEVCEQRHQLDGQLARASQETERLAALCSEQQTRGSGAETELRLMRSEVRRLQDSVAALTEERRHTSPSVSAMKATSDGTTTMNTATSTAPGQGMTDPAVGDRVAHLERQVDTLELSEQRLEERCNRHRQYLDELRINAQDASNKLKALLAGSKQTAHIARQDLLTVWTHVKQLRDQLHPEWRSQFGAPTEVPDLPNTKVSPLPECDDPAAPSTFGRAARVLQITPDPSPPQSPSAGAAGQASSPGPAETFHSSRSAAKHEPAPPPAAAPGTRPAGSESDVQPELRREGGVAGRPHDGRPAERIQPASYGTASQPQGLNEPAGSSSHAAGAEETAPGMASYPLTPISEQGGEDTAAENPGADDEQDAELILPPAPAQAVATLRAPSARGNKYTGGYPTKETAGKRGAYPIVLMEPGMDLEASLAETGSDDEPASTLMSVSALRNPTAHLRQLVTDYQLLSEGDNGSESSTTSGTDPAVAEAERYMAAQPEPERPHSPEAVVQDPTSGPTAAAATPVTAALAATTPTSAPLKQNAQWPAVDPGLNPTITPETLARYKDGVYHSSPFEKQLHYDISSQEPTAISIVQNKKNSLTSVRVFSPDGKRVMVVDSPMVDPGADVNVCLSRDAALELGLTWQPGSAPLIGVGGEGGSLGLSDQHVEIRIGGSRNPGNRRTTELEGTFILSVRVIVIDMELVNDIKHNMILGQHFLQQALATIDPVTQRIYISPGFKKHACIGFRIEIQCQMRRPYAAGPRNGSRERENAPNALGWMRCASPGGSVDSDQPCAPPPSRMLSLSTPPRAGRGQRGMPRSRSTPSRQGRKPACQVVAAGTLHPGFPQAAQPPSREQYAVHRQLQAGRNQAQKDEAALAAMNALHGAAFTKAATAPKATSGPDVLRPIGITYAYDQLQRSGRLQEGHLLDLTGPAKPMADQMEQLKTRVLIEARAEIKELARQVASEAQRTAADYPALPGGSLPSRSAPASTLLTPPRTSYSKAVTFGTPAQTPATTSPAATAAPRSAVRPGTAPQPSPQAGRAGTPADAAPTGSATGRAASNPSSPKGTTGTPAATDSRTIHPRKAPVTRSQAAAQRAAEGTGEPSHPIVLSTGPAPATAGGARHPVPESWLRLHTGIPMAQLLKQATGPLVAAMAMGALPGAEAAGQSLLAQHLDHWSKVWLETAVATLALWTFAVLAWNVTTSRRKSRVAVTIVITLLAQQLAWQWMGMRPTIMEQYRQLESAGVALPAAVIIAVVIFTLGYMWAACERDLLDRVSRAREPAPPVSQVARQPVDLLHRETTIRPQADTPEAQPAAVPTMQSTATRPA